MRGRTPGRASSITARRSPNGEVVDDDLHAGEATGGRFQIKAWKFRNFAGEERFVASWTMRRAGPQLFGEKRYTKVYLSKEALLKDDPTLGFNNQNTFKNSCGPDAAMNLLRWWGVEKRTRGLTVEQLGREMGTNNWGIGVFHRSFSLKQRGSVTREFRRVVQRRSAPHTPADFKYSYEHGGTNKDMYDRVEHLLRNGCPVAVCFKTKANSGHFAVIVGIEAVADYSDDGREAGFHDRANDRVIFANARERSWKSFYGAWKRSYGPVKTPALRLYGEPSHVRVFVAPVQTVQRL